MSHAMQLMTRSVPVLLLCVLMLTVMAPLSAQDVTYQNARKAYDDGDYQGADRIWRQLATEGDLESMFALGALLYQGPGDYPVNYIESSEWYRKAADLGHADAQYNLGNAYQKGLGVWQDDRQAALWWRKAAEMGLPKAAYNLGIQYVYGRGVEQDHDQALIWFRKAAAKGHPGAREVLAAGDFEIPVSEDDVTEVPAVLALNQSAPAPQASVQPDQQTPAESTAEPVVQQRSREADSTTAESAAVSTTAEQMAKDSAQVSRNVAETAPASAATEPETAESAMAESQPKVVAGIEGRPVNVTVEDSRAQPTLQDSEAVILGLREDHYTLQMTAMSEPDRVNDYIRQHRLSGDLYRFRFLRDGVTLYGLSIGNFRSRDDAIAFRDSMDRTRQNSRDWQTPWPRRFIDIQNLIQVRRMSGNKP